MHLKILFGFVLIVSILSANGETKLWNEEAASEDAKSRSKRQAPTTTPPGGEQEIEMEETTAAPTTTTKATPTLAPYPRKNPNSYPKPTPPSKPVIRNMSYRTQQFLGLNPTNSKVWPGSGARGPQPQPYNRQQQSQWPPRTQPSRWPGPVYQQPRSFSGIQRPRTASFSAAVGPRPTAPVDQRNDRLSSLSMGRTMSHNQRQTLNRVNNNYNLGHTRTSAVLGNLGPALPTVGASCPTFDYVSRNNMVEFHTIPGKCKVAIEFPPVGYIGNPKVRFFAKIP